MTDDLPTAKGLAAGADGSTRRELVRGGVAAGAAAAVAAVAPALLGPATALAAPVGDVAVLVFALRAEEVVVYAYEHALASGVISAPATRVLTQFLGHEREHVDALTVNLARLGGTAPAPPADLASFEVALRQLGVKRSPARLHTERDYVSFLVRIEGVLATVYHFAIDELADDKLIQTAAQIMANEGQHATLLRDLTSPGNVSRTVPRAFVGGSK
jgi:hypothetical protein